MILYIVGFCDWFENERRFVILITAANESMRKVHDRMLLILEKEQLADWFDDRKMEEMKYSHMISEMKSYGCIFAQKNNNAPFSLSKTLAPIL